MIAFCKKLLPGIAALIWVGTAFLQVSAQDRVLLVAEKIRAEVCAQELASVLGKSESIGALSSARARMDSLFADQESRLPSGEYQRRPSVKAPEGALDLLRHERHAIVDYFLGPEMVHAFVITRKETHYRVIPRQPNFSSTIEHFQLAIISPGSSPAEYQQAAFSIYQQLLEPLEDLIQEIDQLTIIPDESFRFLPFGALVRDESSKPDFREMHYLDRDFGIGYALSVSHLAEVLERSPSRGHGLALFSKLNPSPPLLDGIRKYWSAEPEKGSFSSEKDLSEQGKSAEIIHLHQPGEGFSYQAIAQMDLDLALFSLSGLKTSPIPAPAAYGFTYPKSWLYALEAAGARCVVLPAWQTDSIANGELWSEFYRALADRQYVDQALRIAKLNYLENAPEGRTHPYYWAGLFQFDDFSPVRERAHFPWYVFLVLGFLLIVFFGKKL